MLRWAMHTKLRNISNVVQYPVDPLLCLSVTINYQRPRGGKGGTVAAGRIK